MYACPCVCMQRQIPCTSSQLGVNFKLSCRHAPRHGWPARVGVGVCVCVCIKEEYDVVMIRRATVFLLTVSKILA